MVLGVTQIPRDGKPTVTLIELVSSQPMMVSSTFQSQHSDKQCMQFSLDCTKIGIHQDGRRMAPVDKQRLDISEVTETKMVSS